MTLYLIPKLNRRDEGKKGGDLAKRCNTGPNGRIPCWDWIIQRKPFCFPGLNRVEGPVVLLSDNYPSTRVFREGKITKY